MNMPKILVTGISGFVGQHLAKAAKTQGITIIGTGMDSSISPGLDGILEEYIGGCDLTKKESVQNLPLHKIDAVINLAGLAQVGASFGDEAHYNEINVRVHTVLAEALLNAGSQARVIAVSTGAVYESSKSMPLNETSDLLLHGSPYALSKIAMETALHKIANRGLDVVVVRPFNHIGPGQLPGFLLPDLVSQIQRSGKVTVGNLKTRRDYTDVRDVVNAYLLLATKPVLSHSVYNVCSGKAIKGEEILEVVTKVMGLASVKVTVDPKLIRPNDPEEIIGDNTRLMAETGWSPTISLEQTIKDFVTNLAG